jgi:hypothetical protein
LASNNVVGINFLSFSVVAVGYFVTGLLFKVGSRAGQIIRSGFKPGFKYMQTI